MPSYEQAVSAILSQAEHSTSELPRRDVNGNVLCGRQLDVIAMYVSCFVDRVLTPCLRIAKSLRFRGPL